MDIEPSKKISKIDEDAKKLIIETLGEEFTGGFDIDSIYHMPDGKWVILELLKCDTVRPFDSHPNRYWFKNSRKFLSLWQLSKELKGDLILINYEDSREQFLIITVLDISEKGIVKETKEKMDFKKFKEFFVNLNKRARGIK